MLTAEAKADIAVRPIGTTIGAEIRGVDLSRPLDDRTFAAIDDTFNRFSVVAIRDQKLTPAQQVAFARRFGTPLVNINDEINHPDEKQVSLITNVPLNGGKPLVSKDAGRFWHSDGFYLTRPNKMTMLHAIELPMRGDGVILGDTEFTSTADAYDALPADMKRRLDGKMAVNGYQYSWNKKAKAFGVREKLTDAMRAKWPDDVLHPVVRIHPITGRKCLFVCDGYTHRIVDMPEAESDTLLQSLFDHIASLPTYRHKWRPGDLLMWDNCPLQHRVTPDYEWPLRRLLHRVTIEGVPTH